MRIENSNLAMQGSSYTATAVSSYRTQEVLGGRLISGAHGDTSQLSQDRFISQETFEGGGNAVISGNFNGRRIGVDPFTAHGIGLPGGRMYNAHGRLAQGSVLTLAQDDNLASMAQGEQAEAELSSDGFLGQAVRTTTNAVGRDYSSLPTKDRVRLMVLEQLLMRLTGQMTKFSYPKTTGAVGYTANGQAVTGTSSPRLAQTVRSTFTSVVRHESQVSFAAQGSVQTADGRSINLNLNFNVSQSVEMSTSITTEIRQQLVDPLVINFSGPLPEFTDNTMSFDIDCDGKMDNIHQLSSGSGYLALDKNGNGQVDDGSELFGPSTNNGYGELAAYDEDGNGWIDENDSIFDSLKIWCTGYGGESRLLALKDCNVGAIYLGSVETDMSLYGGSDNAAQLRRTGLVLLESGESRVMQEMDLRI